MRTDRVRSLPLLAALFALGAACGGDDTQVAPAGGAGAAGAASSAGGAAGAAPTAGAGGSGTGGVAGAPMALAPCNERCGRPECPCPKGGWVSLTDGTHTYRIAKTEVLKGEYAAFLASGAQPAMPQALCAEKAEGHAIPATPDCRWDLPANAEEAVQCADFCDAFAFCAWAGGRLCGDGTGTATPDQYGSCDEWKFACSPDGKPYPYGDFIDGDICNYQSGGGIAKKGAYEKCVTKAGVEQISGNVSEWLSCFEVLPPFVTGMKDPIPVAFTAGGHYESLATEGTCKMPVGGRPLLRLPTQGIRCCADAP